METCLWCTEFAKSRGSVTQFLSDYCTGILTPKEIEDANSDFIYCSDCVVVYHQARERVPALHKVQMHCNQTGVLTWRKVLYTHPAYGTRRARERDPCSCTLGPRKESSSLKFEYVDVLTIYKRGGN